MIDPPPTPHPHPASPCNAGDISAFIETPLLGADEREAPPPGALFLTACFGFLGLITAGDGVSSFARARIGLGPRLQKWV